ncbi:phage tail protein [Kosakonia radicincitans DSM 16656]|uniref:phage tail protein n=1 Tax=Kosakonia radicincitans TaxID=283686 RepID=UPI000272EDB1|nr:phage tail protein [Kosakonia radicincitans]ARD59553.1 phage tail protein [Kosakonia radicincitans DSM 16656]MDD7997538.1 phage tail protein [Kosakonia radicincitans]QEM90344.1 phage tail protein [Kosakonia radicincitans]SET69546.1 hypothetical protein SAMN03159294_5256 [Kosakonia radicincitans]SKC18484.1 hypothetical protein SAMN05216168_2679 [Kosakonia radicincitans]
MMLALGLFVFMRQTLPYTTMNRTAGYNWASNSRIGKRAAFQYLGPGEETIVLGGDLYPELTGGLQSLDVVRTMAEQGKAWPLIDGTGTIYGMFAIESLKDNGSEYYSDGSPRKISFTLSLKRVDESLAAMFGDIRQQGEELYSRARKTLGIDL